MAETPVAANLPPMDPEIFIFVALEAVAVLSVAAVVAAMYFLRADGPEVDPADARDALHHRYAGDDRNPDEIAVAA